MHTEYLHSSILPSMSVLGLWCTCLKMADSSTMSAVELRELKFICIDVVKQTVKQHHVLP